MNITTCTSPDAFVKLCEDSPDRLQSVLDKIPSTQERVKNQQWRRVEMSNGKERHRIVDEEKGPSDFIEFMTKTFTYFAGHVKRVAAQYRAVREMKNNLPPNQALIQMDFSENYTCQTLEEIQSAYWNSTMVTLHPVVISRTAKRGCNTKVCLRVRDYQPQCSHGVCHFEESMC